MLHELELEDDRFKGQFQFQWTLVQLRSFTAQLHSDIASYRGMMNTAQNANESLKSKIEENFDELEFVCQELHEIMSRIPHEDEDDSSIDSVLNSSAVQSLMSELSRVPKLLEEREKLVQDIQHLARSDTIGKA